MWKDKAKNLIKKIPIPLSKNHGYDLATQKIIKKLIKPHHNCIDVGCHKGEILDLFLKQSPGGQHYGFEPIPSLYNNLVKKYLHTNSIFSKIALSSEQGQASFNHVVSNPSYSGLIRRSYDKAEQDQSITVTKDKLDNILPTDCPFELIKIDVEGGEYDVLLGAQATITKHRPTIIFEHGLGASDHYNTTPELLFDLLDSLGMHIFLLQDWLKSQPYLSKSQFCDQYYNCINYYFLARPQ